MKSRTIVFLVIVALLTISGILLLNRFSSTLSFSATTSSTEINTVTIDGKTFVVELATTPAEQAAGLSGRNSLVTNAGMLFTFSPPSTPYFWMKDMRFPLDLVWIYNGKIVAITRNAPPPIGSQDPSSLPTYEAGSAVDNVLEINAGQADSFKVGDGVNITKQAGI